MYRPHDPQNDVRRRDVVKEQTLELAEKPMAFKKKFIVLLSTNFSIAISEEKFLFRESRYPTKGKREKARDGS